MNADLQEKIDKFFSQFPHRHYDKGQIMVFPGDDPQHIFYMIKGVVRMYDISYRGDEIVINVFKPPAFFPMSWAINKTKNEYFIQAADIVEVRLADPDLTVEFIKKNPEVLYNLLSRVYSGTDGVLRRMVHLMSGSAKGRLMYEILIECRRFGKVLPDKSCPLNITETELSTRAGLSRETVSREMRKLITDKLVTIKGGVLTVLNMENFEVKIGKIV